MRIVRAALVLSAILALGDRALPQGRPSILFLIADDYNITMGAYGNQSAKTPNLDRLGRRGTRFDRAYCQYPLCSPSRTSFLSGRRPETTQILENRTPPRTHLKDAVFLPEHFRRNGYFTARIGKVFHASRFLKDGLPFGDFDDPACWDSSSSELLKVAERIKETTTGDLTGDEGTLRFEALDIADAEMGDGVVAREAVALLERGAKTGKPFFIAAGFRRPHLPWLAPRKYFEPFPPGTMKTPFAPANDLDDIPPIALTRMEKLTDLQKREFMAAYYASVSFMDSQVGLVLAALDRLKLWDNTVVVFIGDHGFHLGEHNGLWRKNTAFEQCARTPLLVVAPGKRGGASSMRLVEFVDIYPTLVELCRLPPPQGLEGASFAPLLDDPTRPWKRAAFTSVVHRDVLGRSVRSDRYRYTEWGDARTAELYDHEVDPSEFTNLAGDPRHTRALEEMRRLLAAGWRAALPEGRQAAPAARQPTKSPL